MCIRDSHPGAFALASLRLPASSRWRQWRNHEAVMTMFSRMLRQAGAAAIAVAFCLITVAPLMAADYPDFDDASVTKRTEQVIDERSKDGVFVFHDPKLNTCLLYTSPSPR